MGRIKAKISSIIVCVILLSVALFCVRTINSAHSSAPPKKNAKQAYALLIAQNSNEFTYTVVESVRKQAQTLGYELAVYDAGYDQSRQISQIEICMAIGYDGLMIEPCSASGVIPILVQAQQQNIPIITLIQECDDQSLVDSFVGLDLYEAAYMQAQTLFEHLGGSGNICILQGTPGSSGELKISAAYRDILADYPNIRVLEEQSASFRLEEALLISETWLQKHGRIDGILAQSDAMALGAQKACSDLGIQGVAIVGRDATSEMLKQIQEGNCYATVDENPRELGRLALDVMNKVATGQPVAPFYSTPNTLVVQSGAESVQK